MDSADEVSTAHMKPKFSLSSLIGQAIMACEGEKAKLSTIYDRISERYPYYKLENKNWQNSIRNNLTINKAFVRVAKDPLEGGKGTYWTINPTSKDHFRDGIFVGTIKGNVRRTFDGVKPLPASQEGQFRVTPLNYMRPVDPYFLYTSAVQAPPQFPLQQQQLQPVSTHFNQNFLLYQQQNANLYHMLPPAVQQSGNYVPYDNAEQTVNTSLQEGFDSEEYTFATTTQQFK